MTAVTCQVCYSSTLSPAERERFYAEPATTSVYLCPDHQAAVDAALRMLDGLQLTKQARPSGQFPRAVP